MGKFRQISLFIFKDLFPWANIGWGANPCQPYSYQSFVIAARYFPQFGTSAPNNGLSATENNKRDVAAFFAHTIQETGANDISVYGGCVLLILILRFN
jgi:hypothetical protein